MVARTNVSFEAYDLGEEWEAEQMRDPAFRAAVEELEPAYQAERRQIMLELAKESRVVIFTEAHFNWPCHLLHRFLRWRVNHAGLCIQAADGIWWCYEVSLKGVVKHPWAEKLAKHRSIIYTHAFRDPLTEAEAEAIQLLAEVRAGRPYEFLGLLTAFRYWWWRRAHPGVRALECPFYHCSGFVADTCRDVGRPLTLLDAVYVSPQMIHESTVLRPCPVPAWRGGGNSRP